MKYNFFYIFILLAFISCKKVQSDLEGINQSKPIYKISGLIDNQAIDFIVNDTTIFMNNGIGNLNGITTYYTEFENKKNNQSFKFSLTAPEAKYKSLSSYTDESRSINFLVHQANCYSFGYSNTPLNPTILMISRNDNHWIHGTSLIKYDQYGIYKIPLRFKALSSRTFYHTIKHGFEPNYSADFFLENTLNGIQFKSIEKGNTHSWFLDGTNIGIGTNGIISVNTGVHSLTHFIHDQFGNEFEKNHVFYTESNQLKWILEVEKCYYTSNVNNFERAIISYKENGIVYSSEYAEENSDLTIEINDIEYFIEKENNGKISFKFTANFSGTLLNADLSKKKELSNISATCKYIIK